VLVAETVGLTAHWKQHGWTSIWPSFPAVAQEMCQQQLPLAAISRA
jgi:hypothetical protein